MQHIFYALWHGLLIFYTTLVIMCTPGVTQSDGKDIGFWVGGMTIYGICIFVANFELAIRFHMLSWIAVVMLMLGPIAYFLFYALESMFFSG